MNRILINPHDTKVLNLSQKLVRELDQLFSPHRPEKIRINLINNRQKLDRVLGWQTPSWFVANTHEHTISILQPDRANQINPRRFCTVIKHELIHVYIGSINKSPLHWLDEGLALYLAGQSKQNVIPEKHFIFQTKNLFQKIGYHTFCDKSGYIFSYHLVKFLVKNLGLSAVINLLDIKPNQKFADDLTRLINLNHDQLLHQLKKDLILV